MSDNDSLIKELIIILSKACVMFNSRSGYTYKEILEPTFLELVKVLNKSITTTADVDSNTNKKDKDKDKDKDIGRSKSKRSRSNSIIDEKIDVSNSISTSSSELDDSE